jgi:hypothetical protein
MANIHDQTIEDLVDELNDIITELKTVAQYNAHRDEMNAMLKYIKTDFDENHGGMLDPRVKAIYLNLPAVDNITLASQIPIIHNLWIFLQTRNYDNWEIDSENSQASDREYVQPTDFFSEIAPIAEGKKLYKKYKISRSRKGRKTQLYISKKNRRKGSKKGRKSRKSRKSRKGRGKKTRKH